MGAFVTTCIPLICLIWFMYVVQDNTSKPLPLPDALRELKHVMPLFRESDHRRGITRRSDEYDACPCHGFASLLFSKFHLQGQNYALTSPL